MFGCKILYSGDDFKILHLNVWPCCDLRKSWNFLRSYSTDCCWQYGRICWIVKFAISIFIRSITSKISLTKIYKPIIINVLSLIVNDWKYASWYNASWFHQIWNKLPVFFAFSESKNIFWENQFIIKHCQIMTNSLISTILLQLKTQYLAITDALVWDQSCSGGS